LSEEEIYAMMEEADVNGDGVIDHSEFEGHFFKILRMIRRNLALSDIH